LVLLAAFAALRCLAAADLVVKAKAFASLTSEEAMETLTSLEANFAANARSLRAAR
jgi:hypothetical protein